MLSADWIELIGRVPPDYHDGMVIQLNSGLILNMSSVIRTDVDFAVIRGRIAGSTDLGFTFFVPYDQMVCLYYTRALHETEVVKWFGDRPKHQAVRAAATEAPAGATAPETAPTADAAALAPTTAPITTRSGAIPLPGKAAILERLRRRTGGSAPGTFPKPPPEPEP